MIKENKNTEYIKFFTDICALCKGWYDENKYPTLLTALNKYYRCLTLIHNTKKDIFDIPDDVLKGKYNSI